MPMKDYETLPTITLAPNSPYLHSAELPEVIRLEDPALSVMIDFSKYKPTTIGVDELITNALIEMRVCDEHTLLVKNSENRVEGLINSGDILGSRTVKVIQDRKIPRAKVKVRDVMTPQQELLTFDREQLRHAKVGHIVSTLRAQKQHYALVVDIDEEQHCVCGLFSLSKIGKALGQDVLSSLIQAHTLAELQHLHS